MSIHLHEQPFQMGEDFGRGPFERHIRYDVRGRAQGEGAYSEFEMTRGVLATGYDGESAPFDSSGHFVGLNADGKLNSGGDPKYGTTGARLEHTLHGCAFYAEEPVAGLDPKAEVKQRQIRDSFRLDGAADSWVESEIRNRVNRAISDGTPLAVVQQELGARFALEAMQHLDVLRATERRVLSALGNTAAMLSRSFSSDLETIYSAGAAYREADMWTALAIGRNSLHADKLYTGSEPEEAEVPNSPEAVNLKAIAQAEANHATARAEAAQSKQ